MGTLIANAATTQNLTGAATFAAAEIGALALNLVRNTTTTIGPGGSVVSSATFTVTTAKVIDAVLLYVRQTTTGTTGTFKVDLQKGGVSQASVTVNKADLPDSTNTIPVPVLFKLTSTATGDGAATWTIALTDSGGVGSITYNINAAGVTNFTRALRTTTAATAAAADDLYIVGELTGAGTKTTRTVTMNSTAATAYGNGTVNSTTVNGGNITISNWGTLTYGNSVSTAYILRIAGDLNIYQFGTLNIGSSGAEIPRNSTAVLEFQPVSADGDFGLRNLSNATANGAGLSRTIGKNVVQCKLNADATSSNLLTGTAGLNGTVTSTSGINLDASNVSLLGAAFADTVSNVSHNISAAASSVTGVTQTASIWLARGSGTNNRFVRFAVGNNATYSSVTNGFYSDIDLQAGTAGTVTAIGTGTATSVSIVAVGGGYVIRMTGKCASGVATPNVIAAACSAAGTTTFAGAGNQCFLFDHMALVTASSIADTTFNVDTDTGWLSGDNIVVAATSRTPAECEIYPLNANAGVSSMTSALYLFGGQVFGASVNSTHSGTTPTQAEVGLLTRNVKIRSTSSTLMAYVYCAATAAVNFSWVEFYWIGAAGVTNKRGIEVDATTGTATAKSFTFCSIHDGETTSFFSNGSNASLNLTVSDCIHWKCAGITFNNSFTSADYTISRNLLLNHTGVGNAFGLQEFGGTITNNTVAGFAIGYAMNGSATLGTFNGNTAHSNLNYGIQETTAYRAGTISNFTGWRNGVHGIIFNSAGYHDLYFTNLTLFGNGTAGVKFNSAGDNLNISGSSLIAGDSSFAQPTGLELTSGAHISILDISNLDMSGTTSIFVPATTADVSNITVQTLIGVMNNCKFGAPTPISKTNWSSTSYLSMERYNQVAGDHRTEIKYGQIRTDPTIYRVTAPSQRVTPTSASIKAESAPKYRGRLGVVVSGTARHVSVYVRKSQAADGAAYNGNQPRLIQRANPALGVNVDTVLDTMVVAVGTWEKLEADTSVPTDGGAFEFIVDGDGTAGWFNINDWAIT